ncbi:hypothetical protein EBZ39_04525 [bacterium]|nr:hypothetical protein [bacterium]
MSLNVVRVDIAKTREGWPEGTPFAPAYVRKLKHGEKKNWMVLGAAFQPGEEPAWDLTEHDEYLRIPLFSYDLNPKPDYALAFMLNLGLSCAGHLPREIDSFFIVTGSPVDLMYDPDTNIHTGIRCWIGFAVILKE